MADTGWIAHALAVACGGLVGFSLALTGGGGSILAVPLLLYVVGMRDAHLAIGTSALAVAVNAYANLIPHARSGLVDWPVAAAFILGGVIGGWTGARAAHRLAARRGALNAIFAAMIFAVGMYMLIGTHGV